VAACPRYRCVDFGIESIHYSFGDLAQLFVCPYICPKIEYCAVVRSPEVQKKFRYEGIRFLPIHEEIDEYMQE
jgi:hypothetical protein